MDTVDYVKPADVAMAMVETGRRKLALAPRDLLIRGMLSGAILGVATSLAFTGAVQSNLPLVGALIFPVGLISIVLLGLELVTGSFALGYGVARVICELFREPDVQLGFLWGGLTMGMLLCIPLMLGGIAILRYALSCEPKPKDG